MSRYNYEFDMKYTDNPYIDLIVNCVKILGMNAVVKNENQALHYEDARSSIEASKFIKFKEGYWNTSKDGYYDEGNYMEWNSYYRMLNGLPPAYTKNDELAYLSATGFGDEIYEDIGNAYIIPELYRRYFIKVEDYVSEEYIDTFKDKYIHELEQEEISILESDGTMDRIREEFANDTHYQYLYHLGDKRVDFYTARKAVNFSLLWLPKLNTFDIIENKFRRVYDRNRKYTMSTVYSEAYRFMSYHYDAFIQILIIIQTMVDMISEVQEYIINKDVFDSRTIRYLFESYGIAYYKEIPTKYQIRIIKNVNTLLKYKSSHRNIIDILELFDDDTITVFTYYLMKIKAIDRNNFYYYTEKDVNPKYDTNKIYYIGRPEDISNNKVPLMNSKSTEDEEWFVQTHVYGFSKMKPNIGNLPIAKFISSNQPIAGKIADSLLSTDKETSANSFICEFLNSTAIINGTGWFGIDRYNKNTQNNNYLVLRNKYLNKYRDSLAKLIKSEFDKECAKDKTFALNQFHYKRIKYKLFSILGIFDDSDIISYDNISDEELAKKFYNTDSKLTNEFCRKHNIPSDFVQSEDCFILNHTIPFMCYFDYKNDNETRASKEKSDFLSCYVFNDGNTFSASPDYLSDNYIRLTRKFREDYCRVVKIYIDNVFSDIAYDYLNNQMPRYIGWIDLTYALSQNKTTISGLKIDMPVSTIGNPNIPIYNNAYVYEVITKDMIGQEFFRKNYDLCFLKVPILDPNAYKVIERREMRRNYDTITLADPFWDGVSTFDLLTEEERDRLHQSKKQEILNKEFTIERTKYIAVEASIDLTKASYQICYFMNMLYDKHRDEEHLYVEVDPLISPNKVRLNDLLTFAIALNYIYNGVEPDNIASDMEKNMYINGFNFDTDWNDIYNYLQNKHFINNNYLNEIHEYSYVNEFGETITNTGYGMSPMKKGWMSERYEDWLVYDADKDIKVYKGEPIYGYNDNGDPIYKYDDQQNPPTGKPINGEEKRPLEIGELPNPKIGAFLSGRYEQCKDDCITSFNFGLDFGSSDIWNYNLNKHPVVDMDGTLRTIDISWRPTQYNKEDNNSHGLWLDTKILETMKDESVSDLDKINMLKKIYYSNTNLYNHLTYMMRHAESKRMYDIYKVLFESFMETKMNHDYYGLIDSAGRPVFTDKDNPDTRYIITTITEIITDDEGFPKYRGIEIDINGNEVSQSLYRFKHNNDFTDCWYINEDTGEEVECLYNVRLYNDTGKKEYIILEETNGLLKRKYYMAPDKSGYIFSIESIDKTYLVNQKDPSIRVPIEIDEDDNIINEKELEDKSIIRKIADNYYDFLQYRNPSLYNHLIDLKYNYSNVTATNGDISYTRPSDEKRKRIEVICELIVDALEKYFDKKEWRYIFNLIPTANIQNIQNYIMKMVVFFKSWKTQILDTTVSYVIDDPFNNHVHILDDMYYNTTFSDLKEKIRPKDFKYFENHVQYRDPIKVREKVEMNDVIYEPYWIKFGFAEKIYGHRFDYPSLTSKLNLKDKVSPGEKVELTEVKYNGEIKKDAKGNYLLQ